jgi:hypothetical protein
MVTKRILSLSIRVLLVALFMSLLSCSKEAGQGGTAGIRGKVYSKYYDDYFTTFLGEGYAPDKEVFIVYGDNATYSDKVTTNYDGTFEFTNLRKGTYTVFVYSKDSTLTIPAGEYAVTSEVEITKNGEIVTMPDLQIFD